MIKSRLQRKYIFAFLIIFIPIFSVLTFLIVNYLKKTLVFEKWEAVATLAENSALISEDYFMNTDVDLLSLQQIVLNLKKNEGIMETYITNKKNEIVAHPDIEKVAKNEKRILHLKLKDLKFRRGETSIYLYRKNFLAIAPIFKKGSKKKLGEVRILFSKEKIDKIIEAMLLKTVFLIFLALFVLIIVIIFLISYIVKPIKMLHYAAQEVSKGNYDIEIDGYSNDEIGELTIAFNDMISSLREKELMRDMFSKYLSPDIAQHILENKDELEIAGKTMDLTVMFTDIRGFTRMSESFPAKDVVNFLNYYFTEMVKIVFEHKGTLDKFLGDGLMAIFGAPLKDEKHHLNAVRSAVSMIKYMDKYNELRKKWGKEPVYIGIGINSGEAVIGNIGSKQRAEYTVIGDVVNTASRVQALTGNNEIFITEAVFERVKEHILYEHVGKVQVKNKSVPLNIYKVLDMKDE